MILPKKERIQKIRNKVSERLIVDAYKNHFVGKINVIAAGTGVGKTYNIANTLIPSDFPTKIN